MGVEVDCSPPVVAEVEVVLPVVVVDVVLVVGLEVPG